MLHTCYIIILALIIVGSYVPLYVQCSVSQAFYIIILVIKIKPTTNEQPSSNNTSTRLRVRVNNIYHLHKHV